MAELELNKNDASIDTTKLPKSRGNFERKIAGFLTLCMLFSGSILGPTVAHAAETSESYSQSQDYDSEDPNQEVEIPDAYKWEVAYLCGKEDSDPITIGDLRNVQDSFFSFAITDDSSLEWMNYLGKIDNLSIVLNTDDTSVLKDIKKLKNVSNIDISTFNSLDFTLDDFSFLKNSTNTTALRLYGFNIAPGALEQLTHLRKLSLMTDGNYEVDFTKLTHLKELDFSLAEPYDVAMDLTSEEYKALQDAGVKISFNNPEELSDYIKINAELDEIVKNLGVDKNSTDQEKIDAILIHVLDSLEYDQAVSDAIRNNTEHTDLTKSFYVGGKLYGALEKDTAICGNYAAYVQALAERLGLPSYYLLSENHAWNLITIDGEQYYVDATWLDGSGVRVQTQEKYTDPETGLVYDCYTSSVIPAQEAIAAGNTEGLDWYMEDPSNYPYSENQAESHEVINLPSFIKITPQMGQKEDEVIHIGPSQTAEETIPLSTEATSPVDETKPTEISDETKPIEITDEDKFEVKIGDKKWIIGGAAAIGIMAGLGGAALATKKRKEEQRRRQMQSQMQSQNYLNDMLGYDSFDGDFGSTYGRTSYGNDYYSDYDPYGNPISSSTPGKKGKSSRRGRR